MDGFLYCTVLYCTTLLFPWADGVIPVVTVEGAEISIHTFGAIEEGNADALCLSDLLSEHLVVILAAVLVYRAVIKNGGLTSG